LPEPSFNLKGALAVGLPASARSPEWLAADRPKPSRARI